MRPPWRDEVGEMVASRHPQSAAENAVVETQWGDASASTRCNWGQRRSVAVHTGFTSSACPVATGQSGGLRSVLALVKGQQELLPRVLSQHQSERLGQVLRLPNGPQPRQVLLQLDPLDAAQGPRLCPDPDPVQGAGSVSLGPVRCVGHAASVGLAGKMPRCAEAAMRRHQTIGHWSAPALSRSPRGSAAQLVSRGILGIEAGDVYP